MGSPGPVERLRGLPSRAVQRWREAAWRIALATVTAAAAWVLAQLIPGQSAPILAPIAAVVCLTDAAGVRGRRAVRLLAGVCVGVGVGELAKLVVGTGWVQVAASVAAGMLVVAAGSIDPLTLLQSGIASLIVVGTSSSQAGWTRLPSAVIGGVLALIVSQVLFSPSAVRTFTRAATAALRPVADGLDEVTVALLERSPGRAVRTGGAAGRRVPLELVDALADLAAVVRAVADDPEAGDPPAGRDPRGDRRGAHEVADALAGADPDEHSAGAGRLASTMHLVAVDVAALTVAAEPHPGRDRLSPAGSGYTGA